MKPAYAAPSRTPESPLEALFEAAGGLAFHLDPEGRVTFASGTSQASGLGGFGRGDFFHDLFPEDARASVREAIAAAIGSPVRIELDRPLRSEPSTPIRWTLSGYEVRGRRGVMVVGHLLDRQMSLPEAPTSLHDESTGLAHRLLLQDRCAHAIELMKRRAGGLGLLLIGLRGSHQVHDASGRGSHDDLLRKLAKRLLAHLRSSDTLARVEPDEFALLLPDMADADAMRRLGQRLLALIEAPFPLEGGELQVSASLGCSLYPQHGSTHDALLLAASSAMREAVESGGSRCAVYGGVRRGES